MRYEVISIEQTYLYISRIIILIYYANGYMKVAHNNDKLNVMRCYI